MEPNERIQSQLNQVLLEIADLSKRVDQLLDESRINRLQHEALRAVKAEEVLNKEDAA